MVHCWLSPTVSLQLFLGLALWKSNPSGYLLIFYYYLNNCPWKSSAHSRERHFQFTHAQEGSEEGKSEWRGQFTHQESTSKCLGWKRPFLQEVFPKPSVNAMMREVSFLSPKMGPGLIYPVPCPLGIFSSMGFPPGAIHFSPCLFWEVYILAESLEALPESQHLKNNQLSPLLALTLRNQIPLLNKGKPA